MSKKRNKLRTVIVVFLILAGIGSVFEMLGLTDNTTKQDQIVQEENITKETETAAAKEVPEQRKEAIGQSNKDFLELTKTKPSDVRGDKTGNWRKVTIAKSVDIAEYVVSYNDLYMEKGQVHAVVNFNYNTTTMMNDLGDLISVRIHEYVDKEEHDASVLGSGMLLKEYHVYKDNGDIIEVQ